MGERGQTLIETIVGTAIVTLVAGAALSATIAAVSHFGPDPAHAALDAAVRREMSVARNLAKYEGATIAPASVSTTVPLPDGSPLPATVVLRATALPDAALDVTISATAMWRGVSESATLSNALAPPAPIPGALLRAPGLAPAPTGAP